MNCNICTGNGEEACWVCKGDGTLNGSPCGKCGGTGKQSCECDLTLHECGMCAGTGMGATEFSACFWCKGSGFVDHRPKRDMEIAD